MRTPRSPVAIAVALLAALAAGCGASATTSGAPASTASPGNPLAALTAGQILTKTIADFKAASSVHITGSERAAGQSFTMDLTIGAGGCTGGHVDFTDYNAPLALTAPPASQTLAGSEYGL